MRGSCTSAANAADYVPVRPRPEILHGNSVQDPGLGVGVVGEGVRKREAPDDDDEGHVGYAEAERVVGPKRMRREERDEGHISQEGGEEEYQSEENCEEGDLFLCGGDRNFTVHEDERSRSVATPWRPSERMNHAWSSFLQRGVQMAFF